MATWYSDNFATDAAPATKVFGKTNNAEMHGRVRYKRMQIETLGALALNDVVRMGTFKSSDRIIELYLQTDDLGTVGALDIGLHLTGLDNDGAVIDADLFASAVVVTSAVARTEVGRESTVYGIEFRSQPLWKVADAGAGTYAADPGVLFDLTITAQAATDAAGSILLEAFYLSGD